VVTEKITVIPGVSVVVVTGSSVVVAGSSVVVSGTSSQEVAPGSA
jgi:hypothetical protein